jgi:hypothetical protein
MNNKKKTKTKMCKVEGCKNQAGRNPKGGFFDMCDFHFQKKKGPENKKSDKEKVENIYDPSYKLITRISDAFFINHPKKIRYIRLEGNPIIDKNDDFSITIKSKGRKVIDLPFSNKNKQDIAYSEINETINKR